LSAMGTTWPAGPTTPCERGQARLDCLSGSGRAVELGDRLTGCPAAGGLSDRCSALPRTDGPGHKRKLSARACSFARLLARVADGGPNSTRLDSATSERPSRVAVRDQAVGEEAGCRF
jgi:hypothetical protein